MARECKQPSAPGEVPEEVFSDGGSTPPASTRWTLHEHLLFQRRLCRKGVAVMSKQKPRTKVLCTLVLDFLYAFALFGKNHAEMSIQKLYDRIGGIGYVGNRWVYWILDWSSM